MTIYEEVYLNLKDELSKFYRLEGIYSYPYYNFSKDGALNDFMKYVYFSASEKHHMYYTEKRIKQVISKDILNEPNMQFNKETILNKDKFNFIINAIENYSFDDKMMSIEFSNSPLMKQLLKRNAIRNAKKSAEDRRVEIADSTKYGGGYGLCEEWLKVFNLLTYFYSYQRITKGNLLDFLYNYRQNLITAKRTLYSVSFLLDQKNRVIDIGTSIFNDFSKYELMNALQSICENDLYFSHSVLATNQSEAIKKIIQEYNLERERILELLDSIYKRDLNRSL